MEHDCRDARIRRGVGGTLQTQPGDIAERVRKRGAALFDLHR